MLGLPSGKHTKNYGTSPFYMGTSTISTGPFSIAIFDITRGYDGWWLWDALGLGVPQAISDLSHSPVVFQRFQPAAKSAMAAVLVGIQAAPEVVVFRWESRPGFPVDIKTYYIYKYNILGKTIQLLGYTIFGNPHMVIVNVNPYPYT